MNNTAMQKIVDDYGKQIGLTMMLAVMLGVFMFFSPRTFLSSRIYAAYMSTIPFSAILALGLTMVITAGELDLSFPSVMALSGYTFSACYASTGQAVISLAAGLAVGAGAGLVNGLLVVKIGVPSIIATIGMDFFWRGLSMLVSNGKSVSIIAIRESWMHDLFAGRLWGFIPAQTIWCLLLAAVAWLIMNRHVFGDEIRFIGDNKEAARMMGVGIARTKILLFALMGLTSALVSCMVCMEMANWWPTQGKGYLLLVFASVFVGGTSVFGGSCTIFGTIIGAVIIGIIEAGIISAGLSGFWTRFVYGLIIVVSVSIYALIARSRENP